MTNGQGLIADSRLSITSVHRIEGVSQPVADGVGESSSGRECGWLASGNVARLRGSPTAALRGAQLHAPEDEVVVAKRLFADLPDRALARARARWQPVATRDDHDAVMILALGGPNPAEAVSRAVVAATGCRAAIVTETVFAGIARSIAASILRDAGAVARLVGGETDTLPVLAGLVGLALRARAAVLFRDAGARTKSPPTLAIADAALTRALEPAIGVATARVGTNALTALAEPVFAAFAARPATAIAATGLASAIGRANVSLLTLLLFALFLGGRLDDVAPGARGAGQGQPGQGAGDAAARRRPGEGLQKGIETGAVHRAVHLLRRSESRPGAHHGPRAMV
jgi:hypothetical protein